MSQTTNQHVEIAVVGATGYAGYELARLLLRHPGAGRPTFYMRETNGAKCLAEVFPALRGWGDAPVRQFSPEAVASQGAQVAFLATPHAASIETVPSLLKAGMRVVDLSGAFRFSGGETLAEWYGLEPPAPELLRKAVYGLPELYSAKVKDAQLVANPGCYPTAVILGLRPLLDSGLVARGRGIVCDCKSGTTGAGKDPRRDTHFCEVNENFRAYKLFSHQHTPEVLEHTGLGAADVMFSTHLLPLSRGILATLYAWLDAPAAAADIEAVYRKYYAGRKMVRVWPAGQLPELQHVAHTNFCDVGFALDPSGRRLMVVSCLDNLGKGAAGQAVQNFNWMTGFEETEGLL
ncbi:MAG TPA: N-acetyl-gamma-glutamyl-phosphate reductase [Candidatus Acidoferrales bacterium]|nr:N-acetyl-gamma-glutamyl-phosphate reductase [Candidatus Acidoferrales bacterium]